MLVIAAGKVDGRLPLAKRLAAAGRRLTLAVEKEGRWDDERPVLGPVLAALLSGTGKRVDREAEARLAALVGDDARALAAEVAKHAAYAGERQPITAADVDALVTRVASDKFFALGASCLRVRMASRPAPPGTGFGARPHGNRRPPVIGFLPRNHWCNRQLGRLRFRFERTFATHRFA